MAQPHTWEELSLPWKATLICLTTGYVVFAACVMFQATFQDKLDVPAVTAVDKLFKTLWVGVPLVRLKQVEGEFTSQRVCRIILVLGTAWVAAMLISLGVYVVNILSKDRDSPPPEFFMDRVNDKLFPVVFICGLPLILHLHAGGLRRNWRQLPPYTAFTVWALAEMMSWLLFADGEESVKNVSFWTGIATTVVGTPLLVGSVFWCKSSIERYDASMERAPLEDRACDDDDGGGDKSQRYDNRLECEARSPLLPRGTR